MENGSTNLTFKKWLDRVAHYVSEMGYEFEAGSELQTLMFRRWEEGKTDKAAEVAAILFAAGSYAHPISADCSKSSVEVVPMTRRETIAMHLYVATFGNQIVVDNGVAESLAISAVHAADILIKQLREIPEP